MQHSLSSNIENLFESSSQPNFSFTETDKKLIFSAITELDLGKIRVCEKIENTWTTHK